MATLRQLASGTLALAACVLPQPAGASDDSILNSEIGRLNNQSLLWGPYRPNLYFGVRPRIPQSLSASLMWGKVDSYTEVQNSESDASNRHGGCHGADGG